MLHGPAMEIGRDHSVPRKTRLGLVMFGCYMLVYGGFVFIGMMFPKAMGERIVLGLNLAFLYGMGLIVLAAVMGMIYNHFCTRYEDEMNREESA